MTTYRFPMPRLLREPLLHFTALGALLFALNAWLNPPAPGPQDRIEISANDLERLRDLASKQWGQAPNDAQMQDLVRAMVREEVLVREALANGLERDDVIVRRRLAQKMEFLAHNDVSAPSESELRTWFAAHRNDYQQPAMVRFEQLYFSPSQRGQSAVADATGALKNLQHGGTAHGDALMLGDTRRVQDQATLARDFGDTFASAVFALPVGIWSGPLPSAHGLHLVRVTQMTPAAQNSLAQVRDKATADMLNERLNAAREAAYARALQRYTVVMPSTAEQLSSLTLPPRP